MAALTVKGLGKTYDGKRQVLKDLNFEIDEGGFFTILGPTNAGKSTLLRTLAGIERSSDGEIVLGSRRIDGLEPRLRGVSLLFQNIALFPNKSGFENIAFPLRRANWPDTAITVRVKEVASLLKAEHVLDRLPRTFSGGEQQRIAIGRAIALRSELLMLDEPLTNLDARLRIALRLEFKRLHRETGQTILYVTHDHTEALSLSDRIAVLNCGEFEQIDTPERIYKWPATEFVARFVGSPPMNILGAEIESKADGMYVTGQGFSAPVSGYLNTSRRSKDVAFGVRAEEITASVKLTSAAPFRGQIEAVEELGAYRILDARIGEHRLKVRVRANHEARQAGPAWFGFAVPVGRLLDRQTGRFVRPEADEIVSRPKDEEETRCA